MALSEEEASTSRYQSSPLECKRRPTAAADLPHDRFQKHEEPIPPGRIGVAVAAEEDGVAEGSWRRHPAHYIRGPSGRQRWSVSGVGGRQDRQLLTDPKNREKHARTVTREPEKELRTFSDSLSARATPELHGRRTSPPRSSWVQEPPRTPWSLRRSDENLSQPRVHGAPGRQRLWL